MKRPAHDGLSLAVGRLLAQRRREQLLAHQAAVIIPIPMFWFRRFGRGINSPEVLADCLGRSLGISVRRDILVRRRNTPPQAGLPPSRRFQNVRGAFRIRRPDAVKGGPRSAGRRRVDHRRHVQRGRQNVETGRGNGGCRGRGCPSPREREKGGRIGDEVTEKNETFPGSHALRGNTLSWTLRVAATV